MLTSDMMSLIMCMYIFLGGRKMPTNTFYNLPKEKQEKVLEAFNSRIKEYCFDSEICLENYSCYAILNYPKENCRTVRRVLKQILDSLLLQNDIFEHLRVTIGSGTVEGDITRIHRSLKTAVHLL